MVTKVGLIKMEFDEPVTHLRAWREAANMSQSGLAELAGRDRTAIWKAETGRQCGGAMALSISKATGIPTGDLLSMEMRTKWTVELKRSEAGAVDAPED